MVMLLRTVLIGYVVVWVVLLVACLRKRQFCPIFSDSRKTRLFWLATFVLVNPLLTILYLVFGQLRSPQARPVRAVRDFVVVIAIAGFFINIPGVTHLWMQPFMGRSVKGGGLEAHLATIESHNGTSTTTSSASGDNSRLACRRIVVVLEGDHPLLHRVGSDLVEQLLDIPVVEDVEFRETGVLPTAGGRAPDIFVRLHLGAIHETPVPYSLKLRAKIGAEVGRTLLNSTHYYRGPYAPPLFDFNMRIEMTHASTTTGYESVRYSMAARDIAKDLGGQIAKALQKWQEKYGLLPELPDQLYGAYVATALPEPFEKLEPVLLASYSGLLTHNESYLQFSLTEEPVEAIEALRDAMTASDWDESSAHWNSGQIDLTLEKGKRRIHVFQIRPREPFSGTVVISRSSTDKPAHRFGITDVQQFGDDELKTALDTLFTESASVERLLLFDRMFDEQQEERFLSILEKQPPRDALAQIRLAEMYQRKDHVEQAEQACKRAQTLLWAVHDNSTYKSRLKSLAKRLGDESLVEFVPAPEDFRDAGFVEIPLGKQPFEMELDSHRHAAMFRQGDEGEPLTLTVTVVSTGDDGDPFSAKYVIRRSGMSSSGSRGGFASTPNAWQTLFHQGMEDTSVECRIRQTDAPDRFKLSVTIVPQ